MSSEFDHLRHRRKLGHARGSKASFLFCLKTKREAKSATPRSFSHARSSREWSRAQVTLLLSTPKTCTWMTTWMILSRCGWSHVPQKTAAFGHKESAPGGRFQLPREPLCSEQSHPRYRRRSRVVSHALGGMGPQGMHTQLHTRTTWLHTRTTLGIISGRHSTNPDMFFFYKRENVSLSTAAVSAALSSPAACPL